MRFMFIEFITPLLLGFGLSQALWVFLNPKDPNLVSKAIVVVGLLISYGLCEIARR